MSELLSQRITSNDLNVEIIFMQKFRNSETLWFPSFHYMFHGVLRSLRICQLVGEVCAGVRGSAGTVGSIFSVIEMTMGFLPVLPARWDGCVPPVHSARIRSLPILARDVPGRWNGEDSRSPGCIHGRHSRRALPWGWRLRSHSRRSLHPPDFPEESGLREASSRSYNVQTRRCRCRR